MFRTKNDLPASTRTRVIDLLNARLADAIDLRSQAKQAHWNVKGPTFIALHELFDRLARDADENVDELAERVTQLGGVAAGTVRMAAGRTSLAEYPADAADGRAHVEALSDALAAFGGSVRRAASDATGLGDLDTADLFTEISCDMDKWLWFVEAHQQADR